MPATALPTRAAKSGKVSLRVEPTRDAPGGAVVVGVPITLNAELLHALECGSQGGTHGVPSATAADVTLVAYAAVLKARAKLATDPKAAAGRVSCSALGSEFLIGAVCGSTLSSARKTAAAILSALKFGSLFPTYKNLARVIGVSAEKPAFLHAAAALRSATLKGVTVVVAGKVNVPRAEVAAKTAATLAKKFATASAATIERGSARSGLAFEAAAGDASCPPPNAALIKATGLKAVFTSLYLATRAIPSRAVPGGLAVESQHESQARSPATQNAAAAYAKKWKRGRGLLVYQAAARCGAPTTSLKIAGDAPAANWITAAL